MAAAARSHSSAAAAATSDAPPNGVVSATRTNSSPSTSSNGAGSAPSRASTRVADAETFDAAAPSKSDEIGLVPASGSPSVPVTALTFDDSAANAARRRAMPSPSAARSRASRARAAENRPRRARASETLDASSGSSAETKAERDASAFVVSTSCRVSPPRLGSSESSVVIDVAFVVVSPRA